MIRRNARGLLCAGTLSEFYVQFALYLFHTILISSFGYSGGVRRHEEVGFL
jgi:hypothetical protein